MIVTTTQSVPGKTVKEIIGVVSGSAIYSLDGSMSQEDLYNDAFKRAIGNLEKEAGLIDVDSVIGITTAVTAIGANQIMVTVTGTAVAIGLSEVEKVATEQKRVEVAEKRQQAVEEEQARVAAEAAPEPAPIPVVAAAPGVAPVPANGAAADTQVSALETNLLNLLAKHPDGMDGVGISKKIPRIYYSPAEVSSALKHLVEISKLQKDEFGVFRVVS